MSFLKSECIRCKSNSTVDSISLICCSCAEIIVREFKKAEHTEKVNSIIESGRGKWYFSFDGEEGFLHVAFVKKTFWKKEKEFIEFSKMTEEEQEYLNAVLPFSFGLADELNFEVSIPIEDARKVLINLGMKELRNLS